MGRERVFDIAVVLLAFVFSLTPVTPLPAFAEPFDAVGFGLGVAGCAALWFRRRAPGAVTWFVAVIGIVLVVGVRVWPGAVVEYPAESVLLPAAAPFAVYAVAAFGSMARAWVPLVVLAVAACVGASSNPVAVGGMVVTLVGGPAVLGRYVLARARHAERVQRSRAEEVRRDERLRLAAEIHDVVSHRVTVMVLQAGALGLTAPDEATRQAAGELREAGCRTLDELRDLVWLLNATDQEAGAPAESLPDLSALVEAARSVGTVVEVVETGEERPLSPAVARTAYRVVQEGLTNVRKHAPGARTRVEVRHRADGVRVSVHNTTPTGATDPAVTSSGGGTGLLGLRRRIELINGTLHAGPGDGGGFEIVASLPATVGEHR